MGGSQYIEFWLREVKGGVCADKSAAAGAQRNHWFIGVVDTEVWEESRWLEGMLVTDSQNLDEAIFKIWILKVSKFIFIALFEFDH